MLKGSVNRDQPNFPLLFLDRIFKILLYLDSLPMEQYFVCLQQTSIFINNSGKNKKSLINLQAQVQ